MSLDPRKRLFLLGIVNGIILLHIVAYYVLDLEGIGCIDFFGLNTFIGNGQITAGTVFLALTILITLLFGRIFCGWGCHFAFFQDALVRIFSRFGLAPRFRRSRLESVLPAIIFFVTLLYPVIAWWRAHGLPQNVNVDLAYPDVWHLLPGLKGVVLIIFVDVIVLTLLFGGRAFCRYVCPYGFFLKAFHALSPVRVVKTGQCTNCGTCGTSCPTGVRMKHELDSFGMIHDLNCMNCGDCVATCPSGALSLRPTRTAFQRGWERVANRPSQPHWADGLLLLGASLGLFVFRGREFGDFLAVGLGLVAGGSLLLAIRPRSLFRAPRLRSVSLKQVRFAAGLVALYLQLGLVGQAVGMYALHRGRAALERREYGTMNHAYTAGMQLSRWFRPFTFYLDDFADRARTEARAIEAEGDLRLVARNWRGAELIYRTVVMVDPDAINVRGNLGTALLKQGRFWEAARSYLAVLEHDPNDLVALYHLAIARIQLDQYQEAIGLVRRILDIDTVGNAYDLIEQNPLFHLLTPYPEYRRVMAGYSLARSGSRPHQQGGENP